MATAKSSPAYPPSDGANWFATTHWSVVLAARDGTPSQAATALESLCRSYWQPIFAYLRRDGHDFEAARDLTQEFFAQFIEKAHLQRLAHTEGRFRSFLLTFLKHFASDQRDKARTQKRGGGVLHFSLDEFSAEENHPFEPSDPASPDLVFERRWARAVLEGALNRLGDEYRRAGRGALFEALKDLQPGRHGECGYAELGAALGLSEGGVKSAVHRLRRRHQEILREEIARTVDRPEDIDDEIRHLIALLAK